MNRFDRRPLLLFAASLSLITAVVAYLIRDVESNNQRREAVLSNRKALDEQSRQSIAELRARATEIQATTQDRTELLGRYSEILKTLDRIEKSLDK